MSSRKVDFVSLVLAALILWAFYVGCDSPVNDATSIHPLNHAVAKVNFN